MRPLLRAALVGLPLLTVGYVRVVRPWQLAWGATADEAARTLPGDDLVPRPSFAATRAVTIRATPEEVWPWLVQVGAGRAGWYSYDLIDNLGRPSADRILPHLQDLAVADRVPLVPSGRVALVVASVDRPHSMVWVHRRLTWAWHLETTKDGSTRVLSRMRARYPWRSPALLAYLGLEVGDVVMMRRMLLNLRERVEREPDRGR